MSETNAEISTSHIAIGRRVDKDEAHPHGWEIVQSIDTNETCILVLGGSGSIDDKAANGYAKSIDEDILKSDEVLKSANMNVYALVYNFNDFKDNSARYKLYQKHGRHHDSNDAQLKPYNRAFDKRTNTEENASPNYVKEIYENIVRDRISANNGKDKINIDDACKNLRKLTLVAHCHGAFTALKLEELMQENMKSLGYTKQEAEKIQQQMFILAHAPACPLGVSKSTMISFCSAADNQLDFHGNYAHYHIRERLREDYMRYNAEENGNQEKINSKRWLDLKPSYLEGKKGNLFLVKDIYKYIDGEGPFYEHQVDEHSFTGYKMTNEMNDHGKVLTGLSRGILISAIKNSLEQETSFKPLPSVENLISNGDDKKKQFFKKLKENGDKFWKEMTNELRVNVNQFKKQR